MLNVIVSVNDNLIDAICIHNTGETDPEKEYYMYELINPFTGLPVIPDLISHKRSLGYKPLLAKACELLAKNNVKNFF